MSTRESLGVPCAADHTPADFLSRKGSQEPHIDLATQPEIGPDGVPVKLPEAWLLWSASRLS